MTDEGHRRAAVEAARDEPPRLADGIELIGQYEGSGFKDPPYLARRADGQMVQVAELLYLVAEEIDGRKGYAEIGERVSERFGRGLDAEMTRMLVEEKLRPLGVVAPKPGEEQELKKIDPLLALKFRAAVVPEALVNSLTTVFRPLFLPPVVAAVVSALVVLDIWLFGFHGVAQSLRSTLYDPLFILLLLGLVILSAAFHETGHATACRYGGARPGVMGVGLYLVWPAFYTDVTDAYRLDRKGRLRTDLGGIYFNVVFILLTAAAYFATGFEPLLLIIPLQHMEILHQLLPFIRLDGYYIVSDLTGVPDMFARIKPILKSLLPWNWRRPEESVTELKSWARAAVSVYVLTLIPALLFLLVLTVLSVPRIFATAWDSASKTIDRMGDASALALTVDVIQLVVLLLVPLGIVLTFAQLGRRAIAGTWSATEGRPALRGLAVAATAAVAAFAGYLWLPSSGGYEPISATERGTVGGAVGQVRHIPSERPAAPRTPANTPSKPDPRTRREPTRTTTTTTDGSSTTASTPTTSTPSATTPAPATTTAPAATTTAPAETTTTPATETATTPTTTTTTTTTTP